MIEQAIGNLSGIFWIFLLVIPLLLLKALLQNPKVKGRIGERAVRSVIGKDLDEETYIEFHDLIIPSRSGTTQIDHIYVSVFGIFVIETKNYTGWIFGNEKQSKWTQVVYKQKHYFQNPLRQNYAHIKALSELNANCNLLIKKMMKDCNIIREKPISFHWARHTFGTLFLTEGVPLESVSKMMGHKNIKTTQIYAKITNEKISKDMEIAAERLKNLKIG